MDKQTILVYIYITIIVFMLKIITIGELMVIVKDYSQWLQFHYDNQTNDYSKYNYSYNIVIGYNSYSNYDNFGIITIVNG